MTKVYIGTLRVDGKKQAEVTSGKKEVVADMICDYLSQYIDEGENFSVTIKCEDMKK